MYVSVCVQGQHHFYQVKEPPKGYANKLRKQSGSDTQAPSAITQGRRGKSGEAY